MNHVTEDIEAKRSELNGGNQYKFRGDLIIQKMDGVSEESYVVKDPDSGKYYRYSAHQMFLAGQFNGNYTFEEIAQRFRAKHGLEVKPEQVEQFAQKQDRLGLMESCGVQSGNGVDNSKGVVTTRTPLYRRILFIKVPLAGPDRFYTGFHKIAGGAFRKSFLYGSLAIIFLALAVYIISSSLYRAEFMGLGSGRIGVLSPLAVLLFLFLHESGHALSCKHFGGKVTDAGFLLLYFFPCFYCNTSDAWLLREKRQRFWVTFAGPYAQAITWAVSILTWRIWDSTTLLSQLCLLVSLYSGIGLLFNFNPLIKLDGYYLLSDWLGITNLRSKSFLYWRRVITGITGSRQDTGVFYGNRESRIYRFYGVFAFIFTGFILVKIGIRGFLYFTDRMGGWGFLIFGWIILMIFRNQIKKQTKHLVYSLISRKEFTMKKYHWALRGVVFIIIAGFFCFFRMEQKVGEYCHIYASNHLELRSPVSGILKEILVNEGDIVEPGELVAVIDRSEYQNSAETVSAKIEKLLARKKLLESGPLPEQIEKAQILVEKLEAEIAVVSKEKLRNQELWNQGFLSTQEMERMSAKLESLYNEKQLAMKELELLRGGNRPELIAEVKADIRELETRREYLLEKMGQTFISSKINGIVTTSRRKLLPGKYLEEGDLICEIDDCDMMIVDIPIYEKDIGYVKPGNRVLMRVRAHPTCQFEGIVESISPSVAIDGRFEKIIVRCQVKNPGCMLKPNMTGYAKILCGKKSCGVILAQKIMKNIRLEIWSWV